MNRLNRRELLQSAGSLPTSSHLRGASPPAVPPGSAYDWIRSTHILIAEACNPPLYPALDHEPDEGCADRAGVERRRFALRGGLLLCLLPKNKHLRSREEFLPVKVRIRVPRGRSVSSASLLRSGQALPTTLREGWLDVTVPRVWIHEAVKVDLA